MTFKKLAVAVGVSAALGLGAAGQANATAMSNALIDITNFFLTGVSPVPGVDFSELHFVDTATNTATLNPGGDDFHTAQSTILGGTVDPLMACVPPGCLGIGQNNFSPAGVPPTGTYARSDSLLSGTPFTGLGGVRAATIGETSLNHVNATGAAGSQIILTSTFTLVPTHNITGAGIAFDAATFLRAWTASGSLPGTSAGAGIKWELVLVDQAQPGVNLIDWLPDGFVGSGTQTGLNVTAEGDTGTTHCSLNNNASATFDQPSPPTQDCSGHYAATTTFALLAGHHYSLTIHHSVDTQATEVERTIAEPGALALFGIALTGLGFMRRRRG